MKDAVEVELARVHGAAERGVGEVDLAIMAHHDVIGRVEPLALPTRGEHFDLAFLIGPGDAARMPFAGVEPALRIEAYCRSRRRSRSRHTARALCS